MSETNEVPLLQPGGIGWGERMRQLAVEKPGAPALTVVRRDRTEDRLTFGEWHAWSNSVARLLQQHGVGLTSTVVIALGNSIEAFVALSAAWKVGAMVLPLSTDLPGPEREAVLEVAEATVVISDWPDVGGLARADVVAAREIPAGDLPDVLAGPGKAIASGGSTGRPKIIVSPWAIARIPGSPPGLGLEAMEFEKVEVQLCAGPIYHNLPFSMGIIGLFDGQHLVVLERFDAALAVDLIERERVNYLVLVPTMMRRMAEVPGVDDRDLASVRLLVHSAAVCPPDVKRRWIDLVGAEAVWEVFGATEGIGHTWIRGDDWLERPGSVGRPVDAEIRIRDDDGRDLPPGEVGEVFMKLLMDFDSHRYVGAPPARTSEDGYVSLGDLGWLDEQGFLYPADRRLDMIISGGSNVYPAEVEAALLTHPEVADAVVIGLPDEQWGKRVHAIVTPYPDSAPPASDALREWCRAALSPYKVPKTYEVVAELPRNEAGKIRRRALVDERSAPQDN